MIINSRVSKLNKAQKVKKNGDMSKMKEKTILI